MVNETDANGVRLDIWLDVACLFRTRSEAQKACRAGKVSVNGQPAKPNRHLRIEDEIEIGRPLGRKQRLKVRGLADRHIAKADARALYRTATERRGRFRFHATPTHDRGREQPRERR